VRFFEDDGTNGDKNGDDSMSVALIHKVNANPNPGN
jgi:hypothetical protein